MAKRFSRLKYALKTLRTPAGDGAIPDAPAGTLLAKFQAYEKGETVVKYPRSADSKPESLLQASVLPFYFGGVATSGTIVKLSKRSSEATAVDAVQALCNLLPVDAEEHRYERGFVPAKAVVFVSTGTNTVDASKITGVPYSKRGGKSYTLPYGASAAETKESQVRKDILTAVAGITDASVSFRSERI